MLTLVRSDGFPLTFDNIGGEREATINVKSLDFGKHEPAIAKAFDKWFGERVTHHVQVAHMHLAPRDRRRALFNFYSRALFNMAPKARPKGKRANTLAARVDRLETAKRAEELANALLEFPMPPLARLKGQPISGRRLVAYATSRLEEAKRFDSMRQAKYRDADEPRPSTPHTYGVMPPMLAEAIRTGKAPKVSSGAGGGAIYSILRELGDVEGAYAFLEDAQKLAADCRKLEVARRNGLARACGISRFEDADKQSLALLESIVAKRTKP